MRRLTFLLVWGLVISLAIRTLVTAQQWNDPRQALPEVQATAMIDKAPSQASGVWVLRIAIEVPPDHHGYLDEGDEGLLIPFAFTFSALEERGVQAAMESSPPGTHDEKAQATVLRGTGEFTFLLQAAAGRLMENDHVSVGFRYQICNDRTNVCYPPRERDIPVRLASAPNNTSADVSTTPPPVTFSPSLSLRERVAALFQRYMRHSLLAFVFVFVAGLLSSATPCVYPMLPITSAILLARGGNARQQGMYHSFVYFGGIIFFYALLGLLAAMTGTVLSTVMTSAWVNLGFAAVFAYFGLSMVGLYDFQFLPNLTAKLDTASSRPGGVLGTLLMGLTAGLVVSPCVGPVVGAILLEITGQTAVVGGDDTGLASAGLLRGILLMSGFGGGLGLPFLVIGLLSHRVPHSGQWLTRIKMLLGVPILYFAYVYYLKGMETARVPDNAAHAMLVGIGAIGTAVFMGAFHTLGSSPQRSLLVRRALGIILLIIGIHFLYNGLGRSGILLATSPQAPVPSLAADSPAIEAYGNLTWLRDFPAAQIRAQREQKPLFIDFYATWCANCKAFQRLTIQDARLNTALQQVVLAKIYDTDAVFRTFQHDPHFPELGGVGGQPFLPLFAIYSPQGIFMWKGQNYEAVQTIVAQLEYAKQR